MPLNSKLSLNLPSNPAAAHRGGKLLPKPLLDHRLPRHQAEPHAIVKHRVAPTDEHHAAPIDTGHTLPFGYRAMLQAGFGGNVFGGLRQFPITQRAQQVARQNHAQPAPLGQPLLGEEVGTLLHRLFGLAAEAQVAQARAAADQLLVEPSGPDHAGLPLDRQVRFQFHGHAAQALRVVAAALLGQVVRHLPQPFDHAAHVRRLEALRRAGIVERVADGLWKVPDDLPEPGRRSDAQRLGGVAVELKSHIPIERQARVIGATWLDQQLIGGGKGLGDLGFGGEAKQAMQQRADFLAEQGLAERRGQRVILARNLLGTLRNRELAQVAQDIAAETGLAHRPTADGQRVAGIYRRSVMLASGRYAVLDDGMGFSLVPWRSVIEQRLGRQIAATVRSGGVSWEIGRRPGLSRG